MRAKLIQSITILCLFLWGLHSISAEETEARKILLKSLEAMGGLTKLEQLRTKIGTANVSVAGLNGTYQLWAKAPGKLKTDLDLGVLRQERGFDGANGWQKQTNLQTLEGEDLERLKRSAMFNPVLDYYVKNAPVELKGTETLEETEAFRIEFKSNGSAETFYFSTKDYLPIREVREVLMDGQPQTLQIEYSDYRKVDEVMMPYSIIQILPGQTLSLKMQSYVLNAEIDDALFKNPADAFKNEPYEITLSTIPKNVYKENEGIWEPASTESWVVHIVLQEKHSRPVEPVAAKIELYSEDELVETLELAADMLDTLRGISFGGFNSVDEIFDLRHHFSRPTAAAIDKMVYKLNLVAPAGEKIQKTVEIPLSENDQKTELLFPIKGKFVVAAGHDANEPHKTEWSQHYAYDIVGLGPNFEFTKNDGKRNEDFFTWGREVIAPADGKIVYVRNDVPDNKTPGIIDRDVFMKMSDPIRAFPGNNVIIDHGNGEFSFLAHLQQGSVKVKEGDSVKAGQIIAFLGNSGNSDGPHLHYQLMAGPVVFRNDSLPSKFKNIRLDLLTVEKVNVETPKRGVYLTAE
jgi:hypothetical protein